MRGDVIGCGTMCPATVSRKTGKCLGWDHRSTVARAQRGPCRSSSGPTGCSPHGKSGTSPIVTTVLIGHGPNPKRLARTTGASPFLELWTVATRSIAVVGATPRPRRAPLSCGIEAEAACHTPSAVRSSNPAHTDAGTPAATGHAELSPCGSADVDSPAASTRSGRVAWDSGRKKMRAETRNHELFCRTAGSWYAAWYLRADGAS